MATGGPGQEDALGPRWMGWLAVAAIAAVVVVSTLATLHPGWFLWVFDLPGGDKLGHFVVMGGVAFTGVLGLPTFSLRGRSLSALQALLLILALVTFEEVLQRFIPTRNFSLADLFSSYAGVLTFGSLALLASKLRRRRPAGPPTAT